MDAFSGVLVLFCLFNGVNSEVWRVDYKLKFGKVNKDNSSRIDTMGTSDGNYYYFYNGTANSRIVSSAFGGNNNSQIPFPGGILPGGGGDLPQGPAPTPVQPGPPSPPYPPQQPIYIYPMPYPVYPVQQPPPHINVNLIPFPYGNPQFYNDNNSKNVYPQIPYPYPG
uniref:CX domain-containing protein n=1 Tax=Panagrellus redivivus TaxID=6233 RepID=A0A7E4W6Q0_PANRE